MTLNEFNGLFYIDNEIKDIENQIEMLRAEAEKCTAQYNNMPKGAGPNDRVGRIAIEIADYTALLETARLERIEKSRKIHAYILNIDDDQTRRAFYLRFVKCKSWAEVGRQLGGGNTADSARKRVVRYLNEMGKAE